MTDNGIGPKFFFRSAASTVILDVHNLFSKNRVFYLKTHIIFISKTIYLLTLPSSTVNYENNPFENSQRLQMINHLEKAELFLLPSKPVFPSFQGLSTIFDNEYFHY